MDFFTAYQFQFSESLEAWQLELLQYSLTEIEGIVSSEVTDDRIRVYQENAKGLESKLIEVLTEQGFVADSYQLEVEQIEKKNWNLNWEENFSPVEISDNCRIRAPFHPAQGLDYELTIYPKMSFGTGHHATTFLVANELLTIDCENKEVMDMGCGTGVLGILSLKKGATYAHFCDVDDWCIENTEENITLNDLSETNTLVEQKKVEELTTEKSYQIWIANINKNVLLEGIPQYSQRLEKDGLLLLSGFYQEDIDDLESLAEKHQLTKVNQRVKDNWAMITLKKN